MPHIFNSIILPVTIINNKLNIFKCDLNQLCLKPCLTPFFKIIFNSIASAYEKNKIMRKDFQTFTNVFIMPILNL